MSTHMRKFATLEHNGAWVWKQESINLKYMQNWVGGLIECVPIPVECTLLCNEEGKILELPECAAWVAPGTMKIIDVLMGNLMLLGPPDNNGDTTDLTPEVFAAVSQHVKPMLTAPGVSIVRI